MTISMYHASVPVFIRMLGNLNNVLDKAAAHAAEKKIEPEVLLNMRLFPDMFPMVRQVQIVSDTAKGGASRLAGLEPPKFEDNERSFPDLRARIERTIAHLQTLKAEQFEGSEDRTITIVARGKTNTHQGMPYLLNTVLPNLYFHITTAYNILRHCGVDIGKRDYLGRS